MPKPPFDQELTAQLDQLRAESLFRELRPIDSPQGTLVTLGLGPDGRSLLNFSSNDYLGLANHGALKEAAARTAIEFGAGSGASRLISGLLRPHHQLEEALAAFKNAPAALTFATGYATALGTICALLDKEDVLIIDKRVHACIVDAARLAGVKLRVFHHNDLDDLEHLLKWAQSRLDSTSKNAGSRSRHPRTLIATESVFSMDGDLAPLRGIIELKEKYGAWLLLDEAHATGLYGQSRRGLAEACELAERVEIQMGTLGKALGAAGGYVCGSRPLIDLLINRARSFIFSTAPPPPTAAAAAAAVQLVQSAEGESLRQQLWQRVDQTKNAIIRAGWTLPPVQSPILPIIVGPEQRALDLAASLLEQGVFIPAIRYPTVARGQARLRLTLSAIHTPDQIAALAHALQKSGIPANQNPQPDEPDLARDAAKRPLRRGGTSGQTNPET